MHDTDVFTINLPLILPSSSPSPPLSQAAHGTVGVCSRSLLPLINWDLEDLGREEAYQPPLKLIQISFVFSTKLLIISYL